MKKKSRKRVPRSLTRKQRSRLERERRLQRLLVWGVVVVGVLVVGVLTYGFVVEKVIKAREPVAIVAGTPITTAEFQSRVRFTRMQMINELAYWQEQQRLLDPTDSSDQFLLEYVQGQVRNLEIQLSSANAQAVGEQALDQLIQEELVRQEAQRRGITVSPEELQREIEMLFGYDRDPAAPLDEGESEMTPTPMPILTADPPLTPTGVLTPTPSPAPLPTPTPMTEQDFLQRYDMLLTSLNALDISEQQYRSWVEASLLSERLLDRMRAEIPAEAEQVKVRVLAAESEELANELAARLEAGEDFQVLKEELEGDDQVAGYGSELDWAPREVLESRLGTEVADLAFGLEVGDHSQPVLGQDGSYVVTEVVGHEVRELSQALRDPMGEEAYQKWLEAQQVLVERRTYEDRVPSEP